MKLLKTSFFYKVIKYLDKMHEYSFFYKTRKKESIDNNECYNNAYYKYSSSYKILCNFGKLFNRLFDKINKASKHSFIINIIDKMLNDIKYKKIKVFNQFILSFIIGYLITNIVFNMFAIYKIKYVIIFIGFTLAVNFMAIIINKYNDSSMIIKIINKVSS
ncbi:MAG: hypothetical protein N4A50_11655 [Vallitalea sp.]|jgi:hypothetical protein|nr:hypothetical protein [Vallitalea sp.]